MSEFKKSGHFTNVRRGGFGGNKSFGAPRTMFDAECNSCHARCQVPFRPNGTKPVYCSNCFTKNNDRNDRTERFSSFDRPRNNFSSERPQRAANDGVEHMVLDLKKEISAMHSMLQHLTETVESIIRVPAVEAPGVVIETSAPRETASKNAVAKKAVTSAKKVAKKVTKKTGKK